ncbi:MAG: TIGR02530 family flagellar biosynthesis protein [Oscillospiraceae bacterium]
MLINEYLQSKGISQVTTGNAVHIPHSAEETANSPFAQKLKEKLSEQPGGVEFSKHAIERLEDRNIDIGEGDMLERLNKAVEVAQEKGARDTLVLVDETAFVVSIKNNKVITTLSEEDMQGNIFTNIDSTVIM